MTTSVSSRLQVSLLTPISEFKLFTCVYENSYFTATLSVQMSTTGIVLNFHLMAILSICRIIVKNSEVAEACTHLESKFPLLVQL